MQKLFAPFILLLLFASLAGTAFSQTVIRGYADVSAVYEKEKLSFGLGEQDLFITSSVSDRISFLGESVFKFSATSLTHFDVSIERIVLKYNYYRYHNIIAGKVHTPVSYWNNTYHHGAVFYPTVGRPLYFASAIFPLHTVGVGFQGENLKLDSMGRYKLGYDLFIGNGIGSTEVNDNDARKSVTASVRLRFTKGLLKGYTLGASYYNDQIAKGAKLHDGSINTYTTMQHLWTGSLVHFGKKFECLAEGTAAFNRTDTLGNRRTLAGYAYAGVRIKKWVPYVRADKIDYEKNDMLHSGSNVTALLAGVRYEINYLAVVKLEFQHINSQLTGTTDRVTAQLAVGF